LLRTLHWLPVQQRVWVQSGSADVQSPQHLEAVVPVTPNPGSRTRPQPVIHHYDAVSIFHDNNTLSTCLRLVQLQSNFRQLLTGWIPCRRRWNFRVIDLAWYGIKVSLTQQKHAFTNQKKCNTTQNKHKKLKSGLVAFYDTRAVNGAGLFSKEKISKVGDK